MDLLRDLNVPQRDAVTHMDGPLLVLAGAGSGKTRVIIRRVAYMIAQGVAPGSILAITFTNKAAAEMLHRVERLKTPRGATICTFHSLCARLLREFAQAAQLPRNFSIYDREDQLRLTKEVISNLKIKTQNFAPSAIHASISKAKNAMQTHAEYGAMAGGFYEQTVADVYGGYEKALRSNNALDFDDLLLRMTFLLRDRGDIRTLLGQRYRYILVDEYQDTNRAQYIIAHGIAMDHENICATGDPDQSIYAWRGADIRNILEFEADYPNAAVIHLEENYRSTSPILAAASRLIAHNSQRKEKSLWTNRKGGPPVSVVLCDDEHAEARCIAARIVEHRASGRDNDVGVFYRVNSLSRVMEQTLLEHGIAYRIARGVEFYNRKEIKDVLAYLRLLVNSSDDLSCRRIINTPPRGIGAATLERISDLAARRGISLLDACGSPTEAGLGPGPAKKVAAFSKLIAELSSDLDRPVREITEDLVRKSALEEALRSEEEDSFRNVAELISTAAEFDETNDNPTLEEYLQRISLVADVDHMEGSAGAVTLMTLHAAKGLEFPVVFIMGCEDGLLPFARTDNNDSWKMNGSTTDLEEERRLGFVGMTRAKTHLTLTCARSRMIRGRRSSQAASMFLSEIAGEGVKREDLTTSRIAAQPARRKTGGGFYADVEERSIIESMVDEHPLPPEYEYLKVGSVVHHPKFGRGKVLKLSQVWPETRATIDFEQLGQKRIVLAMTTLELM